MRKTAKTDENRIESSLKPPDMSASATSSSPLPSVSTMNRSGHTPLCFRSAVRRVLAPVLWFRVEARKKGGLSTSVNRSATDLSNGRFQEPVRLEEQFDIPLLEELMHRFKTHVPNSDALKKWLLQRNSLAQVQCQQSGLMTMKEFHDTLSELLDVDTWDPAKLALFEREMGTLFKKVDIASDGMVDWDEFCTYMMLQFEENNKSITDKNSTCGSKPNIVKIDHNKETTTKVLTDFNPMRYVTISKEGIIGVWSTELELQRTVEMENNCESERIASKRHVKMWITDAVTMPNVHKMAITTTNRDMYFYDMSVPKYTPQFHLCALGDVVLCLDYHYDPKSPASKSLLLFGVDNGSIHILTFMTPVKGLFETPFKKTYGSHIIFFQDILAHSRLVLHQSLGQVHSDWVRRVKFVPSKDFIISCSGSGKDSLVVRDVDEKKRKTYVFRVAKGVDCFDYSRDLNVIATGGVDHAVRLWNPYVTAKPVAIMKGHQSSLIDIIIHQSLGQVFSYDRDGVLKCWDVKEHVCIQTVAIRFPFDHRTPEHGPYPLHLLRAPVNSLLICSNDCLAEIKLQGHNINKSTQTTHAKPLCAAVYNPSMNQVITGCEGSLISFWDLSTGREAQQLTQAHGAHEISCMTVDPNGSRLMTGARNGSINVWNASNGHLLNQLEPVEEAEVTGIIALPIKSTILTVGWHRKIVMYYDDRETFSLRPDTSWKGGQLHQDDILTAAHCPPNFLATASFDGDIILWTLDREKMIKRLKRGSASFFNTKMKLLGLGGTQKTKSSADRRVGPSSPVDKLLFLTARSQWKSQESAILVSSEAGTLQFWCVYGASSPVGSFYAASVDDSTVLSLGSDSSNEMLVTGDSNGWVTVWDIRSYCITRTESNPAQVWSATQGPGSVDVQPEGKPPQMLAWHAHSGPVVSVTCSSRDGVDVIISASVDCTARLWTTRGEYIGMFGQKCLWDISDPSTYKQAGRIWDESQQTDRSRRCTVMKSPVLLHGLKEPKPTLSASGSQFVEPPRTAPAPSANNASSAPSSPRDTGFLPTIEVNTAAEAEEDPFSWRKNDYYRSMTSLVLERSAQQPDDWSILGDHYNRDFQRRMQTRQRRRNRLGHVDRKVTSGGGLGNTCSPFQALNMPETREYRLPENLPVSPRMANKGAGRVSAEPFWLRISQSSLPPPLPPLKGPENYRSLTSVNRESRAENASQISFLAE